VVALVGEAFSGEWAGWGALNGLGWKERGSDEDEKGVNVGFGKRGGFVKNEIDSLKWRAKPE
jgi:hypothetical protein